MGLGNQSTLIERLGNGTYLIIAGEVVLQSTPSGFTGALDGYVRITQNAFASFSAAEACVSSAHVFMLSK